jgi:hypothetical protein
MARSIAALFAVADRWGLTFGHVPLVRSVFDGAGQLAWLLVGDERIDAPTASSLDEALEGTRARIARVALLWALCLREARRDARPQDDTEQYDSFTRYLAEWETMARGAYPTLSIDHRRFDRWSIDGVVVPSPSASPR